MPVAPAITSVPIPKVMPLEAVVMAAALATLPASGENVRVSALALPTVGLRSMILAALAAAPARMAALLVRMAVTTLLAAAPAATGAEATPKY